MRSPLPIGPLLPVALLAACFAPTGSGAAVATTSDSTTSGSTDLDPTGPDPSPTTTPTSEATEPTTTTSTSTTGDAESTAGTLDPPAPGCGDGVVDPDTEQCDQGYGSNSDQGECTLHCKNNVCGDQNLHVGVEQCDNGANNNDTLYGACGTDCRWTEHCGDSQVQGPEECDLGPNNGSGLSELGGVGCDPTCRFDAKLCFLTSAVYKADSFLGAELADDACRAAALDAGFDNAAGFMAWISDDASSPATRFTPSAIPYVLPNGVRIANHSKQLMSTGPIAGITRTDKGEDLLKAWVWTGTAPNGTLADPALDCENWTSASFEHQARVGRSGVDEQNLDEWNVWKYEDHWTNLQSFHCAHSYHLYCFEQ
ncbi:MAG TPA: hypothetical protein VGB85_06925 [Nannocystis sp.]|jgi:hypothetical protein